MALFSALSWNVEHFRVNPTASSPATDTARVVRHLRDYDPDVFGLMEVVGQGVYDRIVSRFPDHTFHMTYGPQSQEILVAVRHGIQATFTQKTEFKAGNAYLRPGALLTLRFGQRNFNLLFLHTKSSSLPVGLGLRDDMFARAFKLKRRLDQIENGNARFIFCGDLNTMGMRYPYQGSIDYQTELRKLRRDAASRDMVVLDKNHDFTWTDPDGHHPDANLDHVVASTSVDVTRWDFGNGVEAEVEVAGWNRFAPGSAARQRFLDDVSDHCSLYFEVE